MNKELEKIKNLLKKFNKMYRTESEDELSIEEEVPF